MAQISKQGDYARLTVKCFINTLRPFFRYAESRGWCAPGIAQALASPRVYRGEALPAGPSWNDVQRLLSEAVGDSHADVRARAVLLLFAVYGLRVSEVRRLRLEDLDWERELLIVNRTKQQSRTHTYPLQKTVGEAILRYLKEVRPLTRYWQAKYSALRGLYDYAIGRGLAASSPLPQTPLKCPAPQKPHIYTREEIRRLLEATDSYRKCVCQLEPQTLRTLLLLLYGAGLRVSEALALDQGDVDLEASLLTIRDTKFYKTRLVPLSTELSQALANYRPHSTDSSQPFFTGKSGTRLVYNTVSHAFRKLRKSAGVHRHDGRYQPRIHVLRHSFAVHRLVSWYQSGADVQKLLPHLSTYLGHANLTATQVYLTMTPELLEAASERFAEYVFKEAPND